MGPPSCWSARRQSTTSFVRIDETATLRASSTAPAWSTLSRVRRGPWPWSRAHATEHDQPPVDAVDPGARAGRGGRAGLPGQQQRRPFLASRRHQGQRVPASSCRGQARDVVGVDLGEPLGARERGRVAVGLGEPLGLWAGTPRASAVRLVGDPRRRRPRCRIPRRRGRGPAARTSRGSHRAPTSARPPAPGCRARQRSPPRQLVREVPAASDSSAGLGAGCVPRPARPTSSSGPARTRGPPAGRGGKPGAERRRTYALAADDDDPRRRQPGQLFPDNAGQDARVGSAAAARRVRRRAGPAASASAKPRPVAR